MISTMPFFILAEDDDTHARLLGRAVERRGLARIERVSDGVELMEYLERCDADERPDVVLLDLRMPRRDGFEVLDSIRRHAHLRRLPVVVVTTSGTTRDRTRAYDLGANAFVTKPVGFERFTEMVDAILDFWANWNSPPPAPAPNGS